MTNDEFGINFDEELDPSAGIDESVRKLLTEADSETLAALRVQCESLALLCANLTAQNKRLCRELGRALRTGLAS